MPLVLIVDDDALYSRMLAKAVRHLGHDVVEASNLAEGLLLAIAEPVDLVLLDVRFPEGNGLDHLAKFQEVPSLPEVIILTGLSDPNGAELAIKSGAWDYIQKGTSLNDIILPLTRALQYREEKQAKTAPLLVEREGIVGRCGKIKTAVNLMARAANSEAAVLITGETGTGKELFARAIHQNSKRSKGNFVVVDCAALPETLAESVLFGHERGAFTGADQRRDGLITQADGGTLFLDEVGELSLSLQKAFLRVLQERTFRPVGGQRELRSDFRLVAATNRNLEAMVADGTFRNDLLFRLRTFAIELPPLRECPDDIRSLAMHHLAQLCERYNLGIKGVSPEFLDALHAYHWPGNVRELVSAVERALASAQDEPTLYKKHLPANLRIHLARHAAEPVSAVADRAPATTPSPRPIPTLREYRQAMERQYLQELMAAARDDIPAACRLSGLSRSRLYGLLKKYAL